MTPIEFRKNAAIAALNGLLSHYGTSANATPEKLAEVSEQYANALTEKMYG